MSTNSEKIAAAEKFVGRFAEVAELLTSEYDCVMTCREAEALAEMFRVFDFPATAAGIISDHAKHDEEGDDHFEG